LSLTRDATTPADAGGTAGGERAVATPPSSCMGGGTAEVDPLLPARRVCTSAPSSSKLADLSHGEYVQTVATRVVYSRGYGAFYVSLLAASITEIVWIFHPWTDHCCRLAYPTSPVFFVVESYLTLGLVGDTALRMVWQRGAFWGQCGNVFDVSVSALSIVCFGVYMADIDQELEVVFLTLMVVWVALRLARLATVAKNLHSQRRFSAMQTLDVNFSSEGSEEEENELNRP